MKKILLACFVLAGTVPIALAQQSVKPKVALSQPATANDLLLFGSKFNELDASLQRNNMAKAQQVVPELVMMMQQQIGKNKKQLEMTQEAGQKTGLTAKIKKQSKLADEVKFLSIDLNKNKTPILEKVKSFMQDF